MKKNVLSVALLMMSGLTFAQVGIGTANPNAAALLDVEAQAGSFKGVLIPRIPLLSLQSNANINGGETPNSLLIFNTTDNAELKPGYYFWFASRWVRLISATDDLLKDVASNDELAVNLEQQVLFLRDTNDKIVSVPLDEVNILTHFEANGQGKYTYTSEDLTQTSLDIPADVIQNITQILQAENVKNEIIQAISVQAHRLTGDDIIAVTGGEKAVLTPTSLQVKDSSITPAKLQAGASKQVLITDATGVVKWVHATDEVIQEAISHSETVTVLVDGDDGTFTYYNEQDIDADGQLIPGRGVKFDANTLRITERTGAKGKGIYDFYDGQTSVESPLMTISTRANAIIVDNNSTTIQGDNLQQIIDNIILKIETAQGTPAPLKGRGILVNEQNQVNHAVLQDITLSLAESAVTETILADAAVTSHKIKNKAVTPAKIAPGANKYILVTKEGEAQWVAATDAIIKEVVTLNEVITLMVDQGNGTYTYYNEQGIDAQGQPIETAGMLIDANTLSITKEADGTYVFRDGTFVDTGLPIAVIDIKGTVIEEIDQIMNRVDVQNTLYAIIAAKGKAATAADGSIQIDQGEQAVLNAMQLSVANQGITTEKIKPGADKQLLVTKNGTVQWVPVSDELIGDLVAYNEKVTLLDSSANNGTFTYYNEEAIDAEGNITGSGVVFDANTLKIEEKSGEQGVYVFYDGKTSVTAPLMTIDIAGTVIEKMETILQDSSVQNDIYTTVAAQGKPVTSPDQSIAVGGNGAIAALNALQLTIANEGVKNASIAPQAVTTDKILGGETGQILVTTATGVAQWMGIEEDPVKEIWSINETITELIDNQNGTFTYYKEDDYDKEGNLKPAATGVTFNANTLRIEKNNKNQYEFYDQADDTTPIAVLDIGASVIENITEILNSEEVVNQLFAVLAEKGKKLHSTDGSLVITGGDKAVLHTVIINIQEGGIETKHLADGAVNTQKISAENVGKGSVLTADGVGNTKFETPTEAIKPALQGDLVGEANVIVVEGGENVIVGDTTKKVMVSINEGGIVNKHLGQQSIKAEKFEATGEIVGAVATVNANGTVSYKPLTATAITQTGTITTDEVIHVDQTQGVVLKDLALSVNNKSITAEKLQATGATAGAVATADAQGNVSYLPLTPDAITEKGSITTDAIVVVDDGTNKVLGDVNIRIADKGITANQLADHTITNDQIALTTITIDKLSPGDEEGKRVLVMDDNQQIKWGELDDIVTDAAGNLTTDGIVEIQTGDGVNTLFNDVKLGIKSGSITNAELADQTIQIGKLNATGSQADMVMVTDGQGGFVYMDKASIVQEGKDLSLADELVFLDGNGYSAVLADTKIGIADGGISEAKLADAAVTPTKISSVGAEENAVLTADGQGEVHYKKISTHAFDGAEANLTSDGSLSIPLDNKALLQAVEIGIAAAGVQTSHLEDKAVTVGKINAETAANGAVLTADGNGNTVFQTLEHVATVQGKSVTSEDSSIAVAAGNKAVLQPLDLKVAPGGIVTTHLSDKAVTEAKIGTNAAGGTVLTATGQGGATFKSLGEVIGNSGKTISGDAGIAVEGGEHAVLADVTIAIEEGGITTTKLGPLAVTNEKIANKTITASKLKGERQRTLLITNEYGEVLWADANESVISDLVGHVESLTVLRDNNNGTLTYFNEADVDRLGNIKEGATGKSFDANTLKITQTTPGVFVFKDKSSDVALATIDVRARSIVFESNSDVEYTNVEEAITQIINRIETLEDFDIAKAPLKGQGILINGNASEADVVFKTVELSIANEAVTTAKIKGGEAKQLLVTDVNGKAAWVDATDDILGEILQEQERVTILRNEGDGTFTYFNEEDVDQQGNIIGSGVKFNANTLRIDTTTAGKYVFYDQGSNVALATIDVEADVIAKITEILGDTNVQQAIYTTVAAQGKKVTTDEAIAVSGGDKAVLQPMTIGLNDAGVTTAKIQDLAVTATKLFAGEGKANQVPVAQADGSVVYQPMAAVLNGKELSVDNSLTLVGDATKAVLQPFGLKINTEGINSTHLQSHAVTVDKISTAGADLGAVLTADGSGNAVFETVTEAIAPAMNGDLVGEGAVAVSGGENVLFGDETTSVTVKLKEGGVKGNHIAATTITNTNLVDATIQAAKLTAGAGVANRVAVANAAGQVTYQPLTAAVLTEKGKISTDNIITASDNGVDKVLADVTLSVANNSIKPEKLHGNGKAAGSVLTVGANGVTVEYEPIHAQNITGKGNMTTDSSLTVNDGIGKVLGDVKLGIKNKGVGTTQLADSAVQTAQLADNAVTTAKISAAGITAASMLVTPGDGTVSWAELGDIVSETAGDLTTDTIIQITAGDGEKALLKDVTLSIADSSITRDKLSSKENGVDKGEDYILVTDGVGGFDYVLKNAVQAGGENLTLGNSLVFADGTDGLNVVLAPTEIEVADGGIQTAKLANAAVTVAKINAEEAAEHTVLAANGNGTVAFKALHATAFEGQGANLVSDGSIEVATANKAVLAETAVAIATGGVDSKHIKTKAVSTDKLASTVGEGQAGLGSILTADGQGGAAYQSFETIASTQGKAVTSTDGTIAVQAGNKAALQPLDLGLVQGGIKEKHIAERNVTASKIGSEDKEMGLVLLSDGQGGAAFIEMNTVFSEVGKELNSGTGIIITGSGKEHALLGDATVNIKQGGVSELELADGAVVTKKIANVNVTAAKISSKNGSNVNATAGFALVADGVGGAKFAAVGTSETGDLKGSATIEVANGAGAVLREATVMVKNKGIGTTQLADNAVTATQLANNAVTQAKLINGAVTTDKLADDAVVNDKIADATISGTKLRQNTIVGSKIQDNAITTPKLKNGAVTAEKISPEAATVGHVLTVEAGGEVAFKAPTGSSITRRNLQGNESIEVSNGQNAVLENVTLSIKNQGIKESHIAANAVGETQLKNGAVGTNQIQNDAVGYDQLQGAAVRGHVIDDQGVLPEKISSVEGNDPVEEGLVLMADGQGGASFKPVVTNTNKPAMPKFFYAPSFYVEIEPGARNRNVNVYEVYVEQFGTPKAISPNAQITSLPVLAETELDYIVLHYDEEMIYDVSITNEGKLIYSVYSDVIPGTSAYFNVVFSVRD